VSEARLKADAEERDQRVRDHIANSKDHVQEMLRLKREQDEAAIRDAPRWTLGEREDTRMRLFYS
jgi:hypothetical protein